MNLIRRPRRLRKNEPLRKPLHSVQLEMELELEKYTLFDIMKDIATRNGMEL